jgi:hypothetical protein
MNTIKPNNQASNEIKTDNNIGLKSRNIFNQTVKFKTLKVGQEFECYGDVTINYNYPKICKCIKDSDDSAHEIDGISFYISGNYSVFVENKL